MAVVRLRASMASLFVKPPLWAVAWLATMRSIVVMKAVFQTSLLMSNFRYGRRISEMNERVWIAIRFCLLSCPQHYVHQTQFEVM